MRAPRPVGLEHRKWWEPEYKFRVGHAVECLAARGSVRVWIKTPAFVAVDVNSEEFHEAERAAAEAAEAAAAAATPTVSREARILMTEAEAAEADAAAAAAEAEAAAAAAEAARDTRVEEPGHFPIDVPLDATVWELKRRIARRPDAPAMAQMRLTFHTEVQKDKWDPTRVREWVVLHNNQRLTHYAVRDGDTLELLQRVHEYVWDRGLEAGGEGFGRGTRELHRAVWAGGAAQAEGTGVRERPGGAIWHGRHALRADPRILLPPPLVPGGQPWVEVLDPRQRAVLGLPSLNPEWDRKYQQSLAAIDHGSPANSKPPPSGSASPGAAPLPQLPAPT